MPGSLVDTKRQTLEDRRVELLEEYERNSAQLGQTLLAGDRLRIKRVLKDLEEQLQEAEQAMASLCIRPECRRGKGIRRDCRNIIGLVRVT